MIVVVTGCILAFRAHLQAWFWWSISLRVSERICSFNHHRCSWGPMSRGQASEKLRNKQDWGVAPHRGVIMGFTPWLHEVPLGSLMKFRMLHGVSHLRWGDPSSMSVSAPVLPWEAQLLVCPHHHPGQHLLPSKPSCSWLSSLEWSRAQFWKVYHLIYTHAHVPIFLLSSQAYSLTLWFCCSMAIIQPSSLRLPEWAT